jgi:hypothetical protein
MALTGTQRAYLTARAGYARAGAIRAGFIPRYVQGSAPGSQGGFYIWRRLYLPTTVWTAVKR